MSDRKAAGDTLLKLLTVTGVVQSQHGKYRRWRRPQPVIEAVQVDGVGSTATGIPEPTRLALMRLGSWASGSRGACPVNELSVRSTTGVTKLAICGRRANNC
jgi:hypothetical protein